MQPSSVLDHQFRIAAYAVTWVIQLGYLAFVAVRWRSESRATRDRSRGGR